MFKKQKKEVKVKNVEVLKEFQIEELEKRVELSCGIIGPSIKGMFIK